MLPMLDQTVGEHTELNAERTALHPNRTVLERTISLATTGARVIYISDTYLPASNIRLFLQDAGFPADQGNIYTSANVGVTKHTGKLFHHVFEKEGCKAADINHTGDHQHADIGVPRKLGVRTNHITDTQLTRFERKLLTQAASQDILFVSRLVGEMRRFRLDGQGGKDEAKYNFVAAFSGPLLFIFANWLAHRARASGIKRLYFTSRDCYRLWRMVKKMPKLFQGLECNYFYSSRQALHFPSIQTGAPEEIRLLTNPGARKTLDQFLKKFEIKRVEAGKEIEDFSRTLEHDEVLRTADQEKKLISLLCRAPLRRQIVERAAQQREATLAYLSGEGLPGDNRFALVDIGWRLTTQASLSKLLRHLDPKAVTRGFYLAVANNRSSFSEAGPMESLIRMSPSDRASVVPKSIAFGRILLLEAILSGAPHGSVKNYGFDEAGVPIAICADADARSGIHEAKLAELSEIFASRLDASLGGMFCACPAELLENLLHEGIVRPKASWLEAISSIRVSIPDLQESQSIMLHQPYSWRKIIRRENHWHPWPEISRTVADPFIRFGVPVISRSGEGFRKVWRMARARAGSCIKNMVRR